MLSLADTHGIAKYARKYIRRYTHTRTHKKKHADNQQTTFTHFGENKRLHLQSSEQNCYIISVWVILKAIFTSLLTSSFEPYLFGLAQCSCGQKKRLAKALVMAPFPKPLLCHSILKDPIPKLHLSHYTMKGFVKGYGFTIGLSQVFFKASVKPHPCHSILKDPFC